MLFGKNKYFPFFAAIGLLCKCGNPDPNAAETNTARFDSLSVDVVSTYLADHYDRPIAINEGSLRESLKSEGDSFLIRESLFNQVWDRSAYRHDSVIAVTEGLTPHPPYNPANIQLDTTQPYEDRLTMTVDMRVFGNTQVIRYDVTGSKDSYYAARHLMSIDPDCTNVLSTVSITSECVTTISKERIEIARKQYEPIRKYYNEADLNRTAYYDHQSHMICDGYTYRLRHRFGSRDKALSIPCPGSSNPIIILCDRIDALFDKQLHTPL